MRIIKLTHVEANLWVFEPSKKVEYGRTGDPSEQPAIIEKPYILKLIHQVADMIK